MVTVKMADGLGNQIFRYVCGYAVSRKRNEQLALDIADYTSDTYRSFQMDYFNLDDHKIVTFPNKTVIGKALRRVVKPLRYHIIHEQNEDLFLKNNRDIYLDGYYEDLRFYQMFPDEIRRQLKPRYEMSEKVKNAIAFCATNKTCAIHLRLGDRRYDSTEYFKTAVDFIKESEPETTFILFSNEMEEAQKILAPLNIDYKSVNAFGKLTDIDSFFILQSCQHQILSVGTYGIWAGILNENQNKIIIVPKEVSDHESYPKEWIRL